MSNKILPQPFEETARSGSAGRPFRRQYPSADLSSEQAQLMSDNVQSNAQHGVPTQMSSAAERYTPYGQETHDASHDFKTVDLDTYAVPSSTEITEKQPMQFFEDKKTLRQRRPYLFKTLQALAAYLFVALLLTIPVFVTLGSRDADYDNEAKDRLDKNWVFWIFIMLLSNWAFVGVFYIIAMLLPYLFRFVAHYVNPAYERYWRVFIMMRSPIVILFAVVGSYFSVYYFIAYNSQMAYDLKEDQTVDEQNAAIESQDQASTIATEILFYFILWAGAFFLEKMLITYITIHYHFRAQQHEITQSKSLLDALVILYDYSYAVYPADHYLFKKEDWIIHYGQDSNDGVRRVGSTLTGTADVISGRFAQAFGIVFGAEATSHWFHPRSSYAIVAQALQHPAASAALAKRIWTTLVPEKCDVLTVNDVIEALGPRKTNEAIKIYKAIDENENGDIRLSELVPTIVEAGKRRRNIYNNMANLTHVVNTVDWLMIGILAILMLGLVLIIEVPQFKAIKEVIGFSILGIGVAVGRIMGQFSEGAIFTILDHPYDVGDVIELNNMGETFSHLVVVKRISLLYTVFEEVGSGKCVQWSNARSKLRKICNLTRSGKNKEAIKVGIDFETPFKDLELLKQELKNFITAPENSRDYYPELGLRVASIGDLNKLELNISFRHKSNWSNEALRAARSSRFQCAIVSAVRKVPIAKPGGAKPGSGAEGKPSYMVTITEEEANAKRDAEKEKQAKKRMDYVEKPAEEPDFSKLDAEELRAAEEKHAEKKAKDEKKAKKEAKEKAEEAAATFQMMGLSSENVGARSTGTTTGFDLGNGQNQFAFITGDETGRRYGRRQ